MIRYSRECAVWYDDETGEEVAPPDAPVSKGQAVAVLLMLPLVVLWVAQEYGVDLLALLGLPGA